MKQQPISIWAWSDCPEYLKIHSATCDDVDYLVWVPECLLDSPHMDSIIDSLTVCDALWTFYKENEASTLMGDEYHGGGFLVTLTHS